MTEANAKDEKILIPVQTTIEQVLTWGRKNKNLQQLLSSGELQRMIKREFDNLQKEVKKRNFPEEMISEVSEEKFEQYVRENVVSNFASEYFKGILTGESLEEVENKTILKEQWISGCVNHLAQLIVSEFEDNLQEKMVAEDIMNYIFVAYNDEEEEDSYGCNIYNEHGLNIPS